MTEPDPVAVAVESALTPSVAEAAAEVHAWTRAMAERAVNGWDFTAIGPGPELPRLRLRSLRVLAEHAYATGAPCDGQRCEQGGAAHCHRCAEAEADKLLAERDQLRDRLTAVRAATGEWHAFALRYRDEPDPGEQAAWRAMAHSLCCVLTALDGEPADAAHPLGVVEFPQDITDEEMTRWAAAWDAAQGPERPLTLDLGNRTATFRTKPWPPAHDAVARETAERTPHSEESTHADQ